MKKAWMYAVCIASLLIAGSFAFAEGYINANDLEKGDFTTAAEQEDGFILVGADGKNITVDSCTPRITADGEIFTQRIKLNGAGSIANRSISFPAKAGETITVFGHSSSKTDARAIAVTDNQGNELAALTMEPDPGTEGAEPTIATFTVPADGTYYIFSKKSGINIYEIIVE